MDYSCLSFQKYIYYYQKSNWKKGGPTNFFIFPPRERALSPAGLMGDSMMLLHAWHKDQCGSTDQVAWLNPRFFRVFDSMDPFSSGTQWTYKNFFFHSQGISEYLSRMLTDFEAPRHLGRIRKLIASFRLSKSTDMTVEDGYSISCEYPTYLLILNQVLVSFDRLLHSSMREATKSSSVYPRHFRS